MVLNADSAETQRAAEEGAKPLKAWFEAMGHAARKQLES